MKKIIITGDLCRAGKLRRAFSLLQWAASVEEKPSEEQLKDAELLVFCLPAEKQSGERSITKMEDWDGAEALYDRWACGYLRLIHRALPLLAPEARICVWTAEDASVNGCRETGDFGRRMSLAAIHQASMLLFHTIRPQGKTMRLCAAGDAEEAVQCFMQKRSFEADNLSHSDENRLSLRGSHGCELPW